MLLFIIKITPDFHTIFTQFSHNFHIKVIDKTAKVCYNMIVRKKKTINTKFIDVEKKGVIKMSKTYCLTSQKMNKDGKLRKGSRANLLDWLVLPEHLSEAEVVDKFRMMYPSRAAAKDYRYTVTDGYLNFVGTLN